MSESSKTAQRRLSELGSELLALGHAGSSEGLAVYLVRITKCISDLWNDADEDVRSDLLRAATDLAVCLPSVILKPSHGVACTASPPQAKPALLTSLGDAKAACELACLLLEHTTLGLAEGCQLEPGEVYRLASCAGVALGPASDAAQQAYASVTEAASPQPQSPAELAHALAECYGPLLSAAARVVLLVQQLEGAAPAAALKATICRPDKLVALCHQCAPVLQWCADELGRPPQAALESLAQLVGHAMWQHPASRELLIEGPSGPALAWAAVTHIAGVVEQLLRMKLPSARLAEPATEASLDDVLFSWELAGEFLECVDPCVAPGTTDEAAALAIAATVWLLQASTRLGRFGVRLEPSVCALVLLIRPVLRASPCGTVEVQVQQQQLQPQRAKQQEGQQRQTPPAAWGGVPVLNIEATAVACAALCAAVEERLGQQLRSGQRQPRGGEDISEEDLARIAVSLGLTAELLGWQVSRLTQTSGARTQPAPWQPLLAALEGALRLAGWVAVLVPRVQLLPRADRAGLRAALVKGLADLLDSCGTMAWTLSPDLKLVQQHCGSMASSSASGAEGSSCVGSSKAECASSSSSSSSAREGSGGGNISPIEGVDVARSVGCIAASAAKAARLLAHLAPTANEVRREADAAFLNVALLAWKILLHEDSSSSSQLEGALLPLLDSFSQLNSARTNVAVDVSQVPAVERHGGPAYPVLDKIRSLLGVLATLDASPDLAELQLHERLVPALCDAVNGVASVAHLGAAGAHDFNTALVAAHDIAYIAPLWRRSASLVVQAGLLHGMVAWAAASAREQANSRHPSCSLELQQVWAMVVAVVQALLELVRETAAAEAATICKLLDSVQSLPTARQCQKLGSPSFWHKVVYGQLLPKLEALASVAAAQEPKPANGRGMELRVARALATRVCANPACLNLRGCSEARLRSRRCSGCGVVRYCCQECQAADLAAHGRVCRQLRADMAAARPSPA